MKFKELKAHLENIPEHLLDQEMTVINAEGGRDILTLAGTVTEKSIFFVYETEGDVDA